jgi:hypothetical protein
MRNIPAQFYLVALVLAVVAVTNLAPCHDLGDQLTKFQSTDEYYEAPAVPKGNQSGCVCLLKIELRDLSPGSTMTRSDNTSNLADCIQSYNAIASQLNRSTLSANNLPQTVK